MITNSDITLYNSYYDNESGLNKYKRTYLYGVNFQASNVIKNDRVRGLIEDNSISIYIPFLVDSKGKKYMKPKDYARLSEDEKEQYFTFSISDKVVRGIIDFEITGENNKNIAFLESYYDDVYNISTIATNDCGYYDMQHWRVGVK
ncbi:DUF6751 family protein [Paraclostridium bifermentans]|uniref:DUF6751 family protein n=1 Tax=Paraclostridium bifermentans TaxID=1490 RepID=UPI0011DE0F03|nr:DUF6751 family protein [Paraclostridium bifermentans]